MLPLEICSKSLALGDAKHFVERVLIDEYA